MFSKDVTVDKILRGKILIIQLKKGFRYGFEAVFLASFVNGYLKKFKNKTISLADVGSGVGTISLIIAYHNNKINITAIESLALVAKRANQNENDRVRISENINELTIVLNRLVEKLDEDRSIKDHLVTITSILKNLGEENTGKISEIQSNLTIELRSISKQLSNLEKSIIKINNK